MHIKRGGALQTDFLDRGEIFQKLADIQYQSLDQVPFNELSDEEKEIYIKSIFDINKQIYSKHNNGYYYFGLPSFSFEKEPARELLESVINDKSKTLSDSELNTIYEWEQNTYKIHLNVPPERKIEVLKCIVEAQKNGELKMMNQYKMSQFDLDNPHVADFVFYPKPSQVKNTEEVLIEIVHALKNLLDIHNLPKSDRIPRFSTPVFINNQEIPGMTFVQGNGDFKYYLSVHNKSKLDAYYDPNKNWAVRNNKSINFG